MTDNVVTLCHCGTAVEAGVVKNALEAGGIEVSLGGETTSGIFGDVTMLTGGVEVLIREQDAPQAREILKQAEFDQHSAPGQAAEAKSWVCPKCGEQVPAEFEICWNCNSETAAAEPPDSM